MAVFETLLLLKVVDFRSRLASVYGDFSAYLGIPQLLTYGVSSVFVQTLLSAEPYMGVLHTLLR
jgi:hypothetical protein